LIRERVKAGLDAAKKKGKKFGRPVALNEKEKDMALVMRNGGATKIDIARHFKVTRQTIILYLKSWVWPDNDDLHHIGTAVVSLI
jgi:DNA invertase Pin-like site-specific DNA recombinase